MNCFLTSSALRRSGVPKSRQNSSWSSALTVQRTEQWPSAFSVMRALYSASFRAQVWARKTAATALSDRSVSIDDEQLAKEPKLAIVLGTEGDGLARSTIAACDYTVKIPMSHGVDSLNVAAASAVAFWQLGKQ